MQHVIYGARCSNKFHIFQLTPATDLSLQERLTTTISDFQETLDLIAKYDWDFDSYLEEDVPAAVSLCQFCLQQNISKFITHFWILCGFISGQQFLQFKAS